MARIAPRAVLLILIAAGFADAAPFAYVAGSGFDTVSVIDVANNTVVATISLPTGSSPTQVAIDPDGERVYVTANGFPSTLIVIDVATNTVSSPEIVVGNGASGLTITPDGRFVYVANQFGSSVSVVDVATRAVVATIPVGLQPTGIGVTPDGLRVYVADSQFNAVWVIDTTTNTVVGSSIMVGGNPQDLSIGRDGSRVYVSNFNSRSVSVIDTASNTVQATIAVGFFPLGLATTPDGSRLYVADNDPSLGNGSVAVIDTATNTVVDRVTLPAFHSARRVAVTPDGARGYISINTPQEVIAFDTATNLTLGAPIPINGIPEGIAITPTPADDDFPFERFSAELERAFNGYAFVVSGSFVLSADSDGIAPPTEVVRLVLKSFSRTVFEATLPAGAFEELRRHAFLFTDPHQRVGLRAMRIAAKAGHARAYAFEAVILGRQPRLSWKRPLRLSLVVGNDTGSVPVRR